MGASLRVVTQNIWAKGGDWTARREVLSKGLRKVRPDLVALQEVVVAAGEDQAREILPDDLFVLHQTLRGREGEGIAIASRWPIVDTHEIDLRPGLRGDFPGGALLVAVDAPSPIGTVVFVNYNPSWELDAAHERERQAVVTAKAVDAFAGDRASHIIVAGDFDADTDASSIRFWTGLQSIDGRSTCYRDAFDAAGGGADGDTFVPWNPLVADHDWPFRRIDHILVRCGAHGGPTLEIRSCRRLFDRPVDAVWASDHFGVLADLALPGRRPGHPPARALNAGS